MLQSPLSLIEGKTGLDCSLWWTQEQLRRGYQDMWEELVGGSKKAQPRNSKTTEGNKKETQRSCRARCWGSCWMHNINTDCN